MKMPLFQVWRPSATRREATSKLGASGFGFDVAEARFRCRRPDTEEGDPTLPYEG
jgi:hypothetical protein